jgi:subtilase family serine protease
MVFSDLRWSDARMSPAATSTTPSGYSPAQVAAAYGFNNVSFGSVKGDGSGETIAIVDAFDDPNILSDLATFDQQFGLAAPPSIKVINQTGGTSLPTADSGWATEIALDVEWAHAIAPGANILLVEANSAYTTDLDAALDYARNASGVVVVSCSWGGSEYSTESSEDVHFTTPAGHSGVTFTVAAGDSGTGAQYPSSSPNVLSVGGTSLHLLNGAWSSESVWSGGGGGASQYESVPSYQNGLGLTKRGSPDISYDADPNTGFAVYDSYGSTGWGQVGGTSAGAPQWAALIAVADQGRALAGLGSLSNAQAAIYSLSAADFHDITSGSDGITAQAGYDLASGRGSPVANLVISDLVSYGASSGGTGSSGTGGSGTGTTTLSAPTLTGMAASTTTAALTWTSISGASGYRVYQVSATAKTLLGTVAATANSVTVSGLTAGSTNSFLVEAYVAAGDVADSNVVSVTQLASTLAAPQNVTATALSATSAQLKWNAVSGANGYRIYLVNGTQSTLLGSVSASSTSASITGLTAGSTDSFKVQAYNSTATADSAVVTVTLPKPQTLTSPQVTATATSATTAQLTWNAVSNATGYRIYMWNGYRSVLLGTVGSSTTSVQISNLTSGVKYQFLVEAYNSTSVADSAWISLTLPLTSKSVTAKTVK